MLNKEFLIKEICKKIYDDACFYGETPSYIDNIDELHDLSLDIEVNGISIEEYDTLYWAMCSIIEANKKEMIEEINDFINEKCQSYYGDPAFANANDYLGYKFG